mmetsp:Transcript_2354/g.6607  ORF Transcript_2354/g.6607 Transcript_2354/m.6607 type:complete len:290 (-) Transcript_2354:2433-3302(-)
MAGRVEEAIVSKDQKTKLFIRRWNTGTPPVAKLVLIHGYLEHGGRYQEFAEFLASEHNVCTIAYDARGHGKSSGQRAYAYDMQDLQEDLEAVMAYAVKDDNDSTSKPPLFVLAHSFGGLVFLDYARERMGLKDVIQGAIIMSPFVDYADGLSGTKVVLSRVLGLALPWLSLPVEEIPVENLTSDKEKQKEHNDDQLMLHSFTVGWARLSLNAQVRVQETTPIVMAMPILYLMTESDKVADPVTIKKVGESIEHKDKTVIAMAGEHELLNETNRSETFKIIGEWICNRLD